MPKEITHWTLAEKILSHMNPDWQLKKVIENHRNLFLTGAVIPDTPFYCLFGSKNKKLMQIAMAMHKNKVNSFEPLVRLSELSDGKNVPALSAFLCGVLAHMVSDMVFHPLVYYFSGTEAGKMSKVNMFRHRLFETALDLYYFNLNFDQNTRRLRPLVENLEVSYGRFIRWASGLFGVDNRDFDKAISAALFNHKTMIDLYHLNSLQPFLEKSNKLMCHSFDSFVSLFYPFNRNLRMEFFRTPIYYRHPSTGLNHRCTIEDLEREVIKKALGYLKVFFNHSENVSFSQSRRDIIGPNMLTGLVGKGESDMKIFNTEANLSGLLYID